MLEAHRKRGIETRLSIGQGGRPELIFGTLEDALQSPNNVTRAWHRALKVAGLPTVSFHSLRHYHASKLLRGGMDVMGVSRRLGHAKPSITLNVYGHVIEGADDAATKILEGMLNGT